LVAKKNMQNNYLNILNKGTENLPTVIDLFSGCGGLSFGFKTAGFKIANGIELIQAAANTASYNLHWKDGVDKEHICGDVTTIKPDIFKNEIGENGCIVIGGPPCQAYSQIGRAKLRSLGEQRIHTNDSRGFLFQDFLRFALELNAKAIVMENVPEAVNFGGLNIPQHVCEILEENDYKAHWTILNSADYGVPQTRERVFVLAIKNNVSNSFKLPIPTNCNPQKEVYNEKHLKFQENKNFLIPNKATSDLPNWITVEEAIADLPELFPTSKSKYLLYKNNISLNYKSHPCNEYQLLMRTWEGKQTINVTGHGFRKTLRDFPIFERMKPGDDYRNASLIADMLLEEECRALSITELDDPEKYNQIKKKIVPPYSREKFFSKWKKLSPNSPSHTLVAHLSTDTYSHLHPWEPRGISVREAARLQSFPDSFLFQCTMSDAFKQIGNAVPPLLSFAIAKTMKLNLLSNEKEVEESLAY
jgi:DNA (cytosine-5)-methyltransferase 1